MPNIKSSVKDVIRSRKRRLRNRGWKSRLKTEVQKAREAIAGGSGDSAALARRACQLLDKAATKGIIHRRQAARRKSRLARRLARTTSR